MIGSSAGRGLVVAWLLATAACATGSATGGSTAVPTDGGPRADAPQGEALGQSADELHQHRRKLSAQLLSTYADAHRDAARCEDACELSVSICTISDRLCEIADGHAGSEYYQRLCREAKQDCRQAQQVCTDCAEKHMRNPPTERSPADPPPPSPSEPDGSTDPQNPSSPSSPRNEPQSLRPDSRT